ncbi:MAG: cache domain-containing protein [Magnetococcales bacterium]|nr:cache domain-containing protein [Magnetococcales bacterium]
MSASLLARFFLVCLSLPWMIFAAVADDREGDKEKAISLVEEAARFHQQHGLERTLTEVNNPKGAFVKGPVYIFAYDLSGTNVAHPVNPKLVGKNMMDMPDANGKLFRREIINLAKGNGSGWVDYMYRNPDNGQIEPKSTYIKRSGDLVFCAGIAVGVAKAEKRIANAVASQIRIEPTRSLSSSLADWQPYQIYLLAVMIASIVPVAFMLLLRQMRASEFIQSISGVEPAVISSVGLLFGLFSAFLANDIFNRNELAQSAVLQEAEAVRSMARLTSGLEIGEAQLMHRALEEHIQTAINDEWQRMTLGGMSSDSPAKIGAIMAAIVTFEVGKREGPEFQSRLIQTFSQIRDNWRTRTRIAQERKFTIKWYGLLLFGILAQIAIGVVHISRPRPLMVAQLIFGVAFAVLCAILFVNQFPFSHLAPISSLPLQTALDGM